MTEEELRRFSVRMLGSGEHSKHADFDPEKVIHSFARYWTAVEMGVEMGVPDSQRVRNALQIYRHAALANEYRSHLEKTLTVPDEAIRSAIPPDWTQVEFGVVTFPSRAEADRFAAEASVKKGSLPKAEFAKYVEERFKSRTGKIFPGSGFFVTSEEPYLFGLPEGEVSRAVDTGIGPGVCYVYSREVFDEAAQAKYLDEVCARIREQEIGARFKAIVGKTRYSINRENLARAVDIEGRTGKQVDFPVLSVQDAGDGLVLTYRDFRIINPAHYSATFRAMPPESWTRFVEPDLENLAHLYAVGRAAAADNVPLGPRWDKEMFDFRGKMIYMATLDRLAAESAPKVTDAEVERYYKTNRGYFDRKETIRIRYVYAPEAEALRSLIKQAGSKENIFEAKEYEHLVKERVVPSDDATYGDLFKALKGVNAGKVSGVVRAETGYYLARVESRRPKGFLPLKEVREQIRATLQDEKRQRTAMDAVEARAKSVVIKNL